MISKKIFHEGELIVQRRTEETLSAKMNSLIVSDEIPHGAVAFIKQQTMVVIGDRNANGQLWASILFGHEGFIYSHDKETLLIDKNLLVFPSQKYSYLWSGDDEHDSHIALLMIDFEKQLRFRINGRRSGVCDSKVSIKVDQAYPNCPKYIQKRKMIKVDLDMVHSSESLDQGEVLNESQQHTISLSDTFFVASAHPEHGVDISHRGGVPGFIQISSNKKLKIPDYKGNSLFNTLGNFQSYPYAGLVFIDFEKKKLLQLTGTVEILWDVEDAEGRSGGTKRFWEFDIVSWVESIIPFPVTWRFIDYSPFNPDTGELHGNADDKELNVYLNRSGKNFHIPADMSILDVLLENGIDIPYQCRRGECSACVTEFLSGNVSHRDYCLSDKQRKTSMCLCVSRSSGGSLTLDL